MLFNPLMILKVIILGFLLRVKTSYKRRKPKTAPKTPNVVESDDDPIGLLLEKESFLFIKSL